MPFRVVHSVLTARDRDLVHTLALRVKLLSLDQVRRTWWGDATNDRELRRRVAMLQGMGLVERLTVVGGPVIVPTSPLVEWIPGDLTPDFRALVGFTRVRWRGDPVAHRVLVATAAAGHLVGGRARRSRPAEVQHDLHLTEVFLLLRRERPSEAERWAGEATLSTAGHSGDKVPDALIRASGRCVAVEVCGASYTSSKLHAFHEYCASQRYGYELW